jgi:hypothetical protein
MILLDKEFHFGIGFLNELLDGTGLRLDELSTQADVVLIPKMMYHSLAYSYKRKGKEIDFTIFDINEWIDENGGIGGDFWNAFQKGFNDSMNKDVPTDNTKKKVSRNQ